jgi:hypothetical protein
MTRTSQPKASKPRTIGLIRPPAVDGVGVFRISVGETITLYAVHEIRCEIGGRGFAVHRLGLGELYHVRIDSLEESTCECLGFLRHGYCKHVLGLYALVQAGKL